MVLVLPVLPQVIPSDQDQKLIFLGNTKFAHACFQGVGVALLISQALMGLYSIVGISWMFVFFRDSFITKVDRYRWAEPFVYYREGKNKRYVESSSIKTTAYYIFRL